MIEIRTIPAKRDQGGVRSDWFSIDAIDAAVNFAETENARGRQVYVGAALRSKRGGTDADFLCAPWLWVDIDDGANAAAAKAAYHDTDKAHPPLIVVTGRKTVHDGDELPHLRAHLWFELDAPITDTTSLRDTLAQLAEHFGGDSVVTNPSRIMRLAGSVSWPKDHTRVAELTELRLFPQRMAVALAKLKADYPFARGAHLPPDATKATAPLLAPRPSPAPAVPQPVAVATPADDWGPAPAPTRPRGKYSFADLFGKIAFRTVDPDVAEYLLSSPEHGKGVWHTTALAYTQQLVYELENPEKYILARAPSWTWPDHDEEQTRAQLRAMIKNPIAWKAAGKEVYVDPETGECEDLDEGTIGADLQNGTALQTAANPGAGELPVIKPATWQGADLPERRWVVGDWIPEGAVTLLSGDGGTGKSLVALQLAAAVATERQWLGLSTASGPALVMACEDDVPELHRRLFDIATAAGHSLADFDQLRIIAGAGHDAALFEADEGAARGIWTRRFLQLSDVARQLAPRLIALDTAADLFGANENARRQVRQFVAGLAQMAMELQCGVLLLSHPSRAGMASGAAYSGSTAWNGSVRSRLALARPKRNDGDASEPDPGERILSVEKSNYAGTGTALKLRWSAGVFEALDAPGRLDRIAADNQADAAFLDGLSKLERQGRGDVAPSPFAANYAAKLIADLPDCQASKPELERAMQRLLAKGALIVEQVGPPSRRRSRVRREGGIQ